MTVAIVLDPIEGPGQDNMVAQPSFESTVTGGGWLPTARGQITGTSTVAQSGVQAHSGTQSALVTAGATGTRGISAPLGTAAQGASYYGEAWVRAVSGTIVGVTLGLQDNVSGNAAVTSGGATISSTAWTKITAVWVPSALSANAMVYVYAPGTAAANVQFYVDDVRVVPIGRIELDITRWAGDPVDWGDAEIEAYMAEAQRGQLPVDFREPNRIITIPLTLRAVGGTTFSQARTAIQAKAALLQREGGWLRRTSPEGPVYADVVKATLHFGGSGFMEDQREADLEATLTLECLPDWYGAEVDMGITTELVLPQVRKTMTNVRGNTPARCRIVFTEQQGFAQAGMFWGIRSRTYSPANTAVLQIQAEALTPLDQAATAALAGGLGGGNNVIRHPSLGTSWTHVLSTRINGGQQELTHVGTYSIWVRVYAPAGPSTTPPQLRFLWDVGDLSLPVTNDPVQVPGFDNFFLVNLGTVRLVPPPLGTYRWQGVVQGQGQVGGDVISIDTMWFVPMNDGYGTLRAPSTSASIGLAGYAARDEFNQTPGALLGKALPVGGVWFGFGTTTDFQVTVFTAPNVPYTNFAGRTAANDVGFAGRFAIAGTAVSTVQTVQVTTTAALHGQPSTSIAGGGPTARFVDASNHLTVVLAGGSSVTRAFSAPVATVNVVVAGVRTILSNSLPALTGLPAGPTTITVSVTADGVVRVWFTARGAALGEPYFLSSHPALATGGALASGKVGFFDINTSTTTGTRPYDGFAAWITPLDAVAYANQTLELRTSGMYRKDATGTSYGPVSIFAGGLPRIPPSGLEGRTVELMVKGSRGDLQALPDGGVSDDSSVQVFLRPCWLYLTE